MKKHNERFRNKFGMTGRHAELVSASILFFVLLFAACKSVPSGTIVKAPELLEKNKNFYISIPSEVDPELVKYLIKSNVEGLSDSDVNELASRINRAYAGLNADNKDSKLQLAIDSNIPVKYIPKLLTKKNGWTVEQYTGPTSSTKYGLYTQKDITLAFPSDKLALLGDNVSGMLDRYDEIHSIPADDSVGKSYALLDDKTYEHITESSSEIRFITNKPETFLLMLTGQKLTLQLNTVRGSFVCDPKNDNQYILDFIFDFKSAVVAKAGKVMLGFVFGLADGDDNSLQANEVKITGIKIKKQQLYDILSL